MGKSGLGNPSSRPERRYKATGAAQSTSFDPPRPNMLRTEPTYIVVAGNLADWLSLLRAHERSREDKWLSTAAIAPETAIEFTLCVQKS